MLSEEPDTSPGAAIEPSSNGSESTLHDAVLLTLCYREIFEFPLTRQELHRYLILAAADESALHRSLTELEGRHVTLLDNYVLPPGGESMLELREARRHASAHCWRWALRYARWLRWVPFVRMVGVTGSVAVHNAEDTADIDLFCVTAPQRMWVARFGMALLSRVSRRFLPFRACLNTSVSEAEMELPDQNLYIAHQIALMVPVWGETVYRRFMASNGWVRNFFPQFKPDEQGAVAEQATPRLVRGIEWLLGGRWGAWLNRRIYRLGLRTAMQRDCPGPEDGPARIHQSRRLESFRLVTSHVHEIHERFAQCWRKRMGDRHTIHDTARLFGLDPDAPPPPLAPKKAERARRRASYYKAVGRYFDEEAGAFSDRYFANLTLQRIRSAFREATHRYPFRNALEIGMGPGLDLEYWGRERPDAQFTGLDISPAMAAESERRVREAGLTNVRCAVGSVEDLAKLFPGERFDMVYVYFGALNTVADLSVAARAIRGCMKEDGVAVLTFVNRWFMEETLRYLLTFRWRRAFARWRRVWGGYANDRSLESRCYSPRQVRRAFAPLLRNVHTEGFSILHPAWYRDKWVKRYPRFCDWLWRADRFLSRTPFWCFGEYGLYVFKPRDHVRNGRPRIAEAERAPVEEGVVTGSQPDRTAERLDQ